MKNNPFLKKLGFSTDDRLIIVHADDVGMCQASISAFEQLIEQKTLTSGAFMAPCSWFPSVASYCTQHPKVDLGVHLTVTSEWENYRWRPISTCDPESGLIDSDGYFFSNNAEVQKKAIPSYIRAEVLAQVNQAVAAGIDVSHIDMHMGAMLHPNFLPSYLEVARTHRIPMLAYRMPEEKLKKWNNPQLATKINQILDELEDEGYPVFDHFYQTDLYKPEKRMEEISLSLKSIPPGLTHYILHPSHDTAELRAITPDWEGRVADYNALVNGEFSDLLKKSNIYTVGYRDLKDVM